MQDDSTPLMKQYWELKAQAADALLLFRMGDFYELFGNDAVEASRILEITLTSRDRKSPNPMPMAGVPHHSVQGYLQKLLRAGKKVAIAEQMTDPGAAKLVKREIIRVFTPGVQFDLEGSEANYLGAIVSSDEKWTLACLDASTGEALVSDPLLPEDLAMELASRPLKQLLCFGLPPKLETPSSLLVENLPSNYLSALQAEEWLKKHYELASLEAFLRAPSAIHALGIAVVYALRTQQQERLAHLRLPEPLHQPKTMTLGPGAAQHLDLLTDSGPNLFDLMNHTRSALGARQLKRWLLAPLKSPSEISARQEAVFEFSKSGLREKLSSECAEIYDLERISGRINAKLANPRDTLALGKSLSRLSRITSLMEGMKAPALKELRAKLVARANELFPLANRIIQNQREDAPLASREGEIFNVGTSPDLDQLIALTEDGSRWLVELETREREKTGIPSLKVRYNRVFGYYIEITQAHLKNVPSHYLRKQTMVGAERFFTEELKKFEDDILNASTRKIALEQELFLDLLKEAQAQTRPIMETAQCLGELDALVSLAKLVEEPGWVFPLIDEGLSLSIEEGRHPLIDAFTQGSFVPNSLSLSPETRLALMITGPNMGGKSTVMRQTALILILGQIGAPVPAAKATWGAASSLYTRIGAHDAIARGQSTFMVEMSELAHILHHADERSFIVLDEIGRGTSTYDGMSVAWATLEWICSQIRARTLFATHYHELTRLARTLPLLANAHMAVESPASEGGKLRFLYKLKEGPTNESFGIHVARLAGLPKAVIDRAWECLEELETGHSPERQLEKVNVSLKVERKSDQLSLFDLA